ncbi:TetR/AcrR family transcriptional regulator [Actinoplanes sp. N902-109]|uniref:TetR/AcrR family transcriptional regulator n=1 Tax=Actinoplanes sp. (strain N902-109) TaxID=649831 RepID=UPI0003296371|nr:TetR/AcrR family transcriptional regulator [Actinoplanes sp. N902-109]AGL18534.1 TetR family transcriptional regulator [Actinoplanes sp. N902-109]
MPTGVALRDVREQLFAAAERVLLRAGPAGLTSRAVTAEAGVAKGVLHKHFADFDAFLAELVVDRTAQLTLQEAALRAGAGRGDVIGTVTDTLTRLFSSIAAAVLALVIARDGLRARLRATTPTGVPMLTEATWMVAGYLAAEKDAGRIAADADVDMLALTLIGSSHLMTAGGEAPTPDPAAVRKVVTTVLAAVLS